SPPLVRPPLRTSGPRLLFFALVRSITKRARAARVARHVEAWQQVMHRARRARVSARQWSKAMVYAVTPRLCVPSLARCVLVIEDDASARSALLRLLTVSGFRTLAAATLAGAYEQL